jgi:hypothetical protein
LLIIGTRFVIDAEGYVIVIIIAKLRPIYDCQLVILCAVAERIEPDYVGILNCISDAIAIKRYGRRDCNLAFESGLVTLFEGN